LGEREEGENKRVRGILSSFFRTKRERKRAISQLPPLLSPLLTIFEKERENREGERGRGRENNSCDLGEIIQNVFFFFVTFFILLFSHRGSGDVPPLVLLFLLLLEA
jgi:hypothetical protein